MGTAVSKPDSAEEGGLVGLCCCEKRGPQDSDFGSKGLPPPRMSRRMSVKLTEDSLEHNENIQVESPRSTQLPRKGILTNGNFSSSDNKLKKSPSDLSKHSDTLIPKSSSGSWRSSRLDAPNADTEKIEKTDSSSDLTSKEIYSLENSIKMAAAYQKVKPPNFFAVQVRKQPNSFRFKPNDIPSNDAL